MSAIREDWLNQTVTPLERAEQEKQRDLKAKKERLEQETKQIDNLKQQFERKREERIKQIIAKWDDKTRQDEIDAFLEQTDDFTRAQYNRSGMKRKSVQAAFRNYVRDKHLTLEERDFKRWAKGRG